MTILVRAIVRFAQSGCSVLRQRYNPTHSLIIRLGEAGLHDFLALSPKVRPQNVGESATIASLQRVQNAVVLLDRKRPMLGRHRGDEARSPDARRDRFIKSGEHRVIGGANDALTGK